MKEFVGDLNAAELRVGFIVSRFNSMVTERLLQGALGAFKQFGGKDENCVVLHVPGSFELVVAAERLAGQSDLDAIVCLGCLIRGETPHFDVLANEVTRGIDEVALKHNLPVSYGVITADTVEQAVNRSGVKHGNKGVEALSAAVEMANLFKRLGSE